MSQENEESMNIYQRLNAVMQEVEYVQKDAVVQGYKAVTHDQVTAAVRKHFVEKGVVVATSCIASSVITRRGEVLSDGGEAQKMMLYTADFIVSFVNIDKPDDYLAVQINAHAADNGDKAPGKAMSYATKYAILKVLSLETGENDESRAPGEVTKHSQLQKDAFDDLIETRPGIDYVCFAKQVGEDVMASLFNSFASGQISSGKKHCRELEADGWETLKGLALEVGEFTQATDHHGALELVDDLTDMEKRLLRGLLNEEEVKFLTEAKEL